MLMRRIVDVLFGFCCLVLAAPCMLIIAILIKRTSPGPIFYIPKMVGQHGQLFPLFRFRTMYTAPADQRMPDQPVTPIGWFIRNYSLDHLPTLLNLIVGHITIIGPRPMELAVVDMRDPTWRRYFQIMPGFFNYAVLKLGNMWTPSRISHPERNQTLELTYIQQQSGWGDSKLFLQFLAAWISSKGNVKARKNAEVPLDD